MHLADAHVHFFSHRFFSLLAGDPAATGAKLGWEIPPPNPVDLARRWVQELDRHGVARAALIASIPGDEGSVLAARSAFPDRFLAFAMVNPLPDATPDPSLDAICLFPAMHRYSIAGPEAARIIEPASVIFVHCGVLSVGVRKKLGLPSQFDMRYSNPLDLHSVALKYPAKKFIVPHFGAGMLREALMLCDLCPNVFLDTSSSNSWIQYEGLDLRTVFRRALNVAGPTRLLFGTDSSFFPRGWNRAIFDAQKAALDALGIAEDDQRRIFHDNLQTLFSARAAVHST